MPSLFSKVIFGKNSGAKIPRQTPKHPGFRYINLYNDTVFRFRQRGVIEVIALIILAILAIALPITVRFVQVAQEIRSRAAAEPGAGGGPYPTQPPAAPQVPSVTPSPAPLPTVTAAPSPPPPPSPSPSPPAPITPTPQTTAPTPSPQPAPSGGCLPDDAPCLASRQAFDSCKSQGQSDDTCWHSASDAWLTVEGENAKKAGRGDVVAQKKAQQWFVMQDVEKRAASGDGAAQKLLTQYQNPDQFVQAVYAPKVENCIDVACQGADIARRSCQDFNSVKQGSLNCEAQAHAAYDETKAAVCASPNSDACQKIIAAENLGPVGVARMLTQAGVAAQAATPAQQKARDAVSFEDAQILTAASAYFAALARGELPPEWAASLIKDVSANPIKYSRFNLDLNAKKLTFSGELGGTYTTITVTGSGANLDYTGINERTALSGGVNLSLLYNDKVQDRVGTLISCYITGTCLNPENQGAFGYGTLAALLGSENQAALVQLGQIKAGEVGAKKITFTLAGQPVDLDISLNKGADNKFTYTVVLAGTTYGVGRSAELSYAGAVSPSQLVAWDLCHELKAEGSDFEDCANAQKQLIEQGQAVNVDRTTGKVDVRLGWKVPDHTECAGVDSAQTVYTDGTRSKTFSPPAGKVCSDGDFVTQAELDRRAAGAGTAISYCYSAGLGQQCVKQYKDYIKSGFNVDASGGVVPATPDSVKNYCGQVTLAGVASDYVQVGRDIYSCGSGKKSEANCVGKTGIQELPDGSYFNCDSGEKATSSDIASAFCQIQAAKGASKPLATCVSQWIDNIDKSQYFPGLFAARQPIASGCSANGAGIAVTYNDGSSATLACGSGKRCFARDCIAEALATTGQTECGRESEAGRSAGSACKLAVKRKDTDFRLYEFSTEVLNNAPGDDPVKREEVRRDLVKILKDHGFTVDDLTNAYERLVSGKFITKNGITISVTSDHKLNVFDDSLPKAEKLAMAADFVPDPGKDTAGDGMSDYRKILVLKKDPTAQFSLTQKNDQGDIFSSIGLIRDYRCVSLIGETCDGKPFELPLLSAVGRSSRGDFLDNLGLGLDANQSRAVNAATSAVGGVVGGFLDTVGLGASSIWNGLTGQPQPVPVVAAHPPGEQVAPEETVRLSLGGVWNFVRDLGVGVPTFVVQSGLSGTYRVGTYLALESRLGGAVFDRLPENCRNYQNNSVNRLDSGCVALYDKLRDEVRSDLINKDPALKQEHFLAYRKAYSELGDGASAAEVQKKVNETFGTPASLARGTVESLIFVTSFAGAARPAALPAIEIPGFTPAINAFEKAGNTAVSALGKRAPALFPALSPEVTNIAELQAKRAGLETGIERVLTAVKVPRPLVAGTASYFGQIPLRAVGAAPLATMIGVLEVPQQVISANILCGELQAQYKVACGDASGLAQLPADVQKSYAYAGDLTKPANLVGAGVQVASEWIRFPVLYGPVIGRITETALKPVSLLRAPAPEVARPNLSLRLTDERIAEIAKANNMSAADTAIIEAELNKTLSDNAGKPAEEVRKAAEARLTQLIPQVSGVTGLSAPQLAAARAELAQQLELETRIARVNAPSPSGLSTSDLARLTLEARELASSVDRERALGGQPALTLADRQVIENRLKVARTTPADRAKINFETPATQEDLATYLRDSAYTKAQSVEDLARRIVEAKSVTAGRDLFADPESVARAKAMAEETWLRRNQKDPLARDKVVVDGVTDIGDLAEGSLRLRLATRTNELIDSALRDTSASRLSERVDNIKRQITGSLNSYFDLHTGRFSESFRSEMRQAALSEVRRRLPERTDLHEALANEIITNVEVRFNEAARAKLAADLSSKVDLRDPSLAAQTTAAPGDIVLKQAVLLPLSRTVDVSPRPALAARIADFGAFKAPQVVPAAQPAGGPQALEQPAKPAAPSTGSGPTTAARLASGGLRQVYRLENTVRDFIGSRLPKAQVAPVTLKPEIKNLVETLASQRVQRGATAVESSTGGAGPLLSIAAEKIKVTQNGVGREVERTKLELTKVGGSAGLKQSDVDFLNATIRTFENYQAEVNPKFEKLRAQPGAALDQSNFVLGALEQFGIKGARGAIFGALPGLGKTDLVIPLNIYIQAKMTGEGQFVIFPDRPLMEQFLKTNESLARFYDRELGPDSVLILRPGEPSPSTEAIARAKIIIATRDIAFTLRNTDTPGGAALRNKWRSSYLDGDEIHWTLNPFENYRQTFGEQRQITSSLEGQGYLSAKDAVTSLPSLKELIDGRKAGQTPEGVGKARDGRTGRYSDSRELAILKEWLASKGDRLPTELASLKTESDVSRLRQSLKNYLDSHPNDALGALGKELTVIYKLADVLAAVPGNEYGPAEVAGKTVIAPREQGHITGRQYQGVADQLIYNTVGAEINRVTIDFSALTKSERSRDINFAQLMFEPKGFALYTGTPELVARLFKDAYGIKLTQFTGPAYDVVRMRLAEGRDVVAGQKASVYGNLGDAVAHQDVSKNQVYINIDESRPNVVIRDEVARLHRNQRMFEVVRSDLFIEGTVDTQGAFHEIARFTDKDALNTRTQALDAVGERYIKLYDYGAHTGVDTFNDVALSHGTVIVGNSDETTFAQAVNRLRPNDQGQYPPVDVVFVADKSVPATLEAVDGFLSKNQSQNLAQAEVLFKESLLNNSVDILINNLEAKANQTALFGLIKADKALVARLEELRDSFKQVQELAYSPGSEVDAATKLEATLERVQRIYREIGTAVSGNPAVAAEFDREAAGFDRLKINFAATVNENFRLGAEPTLARVVDLVNQTSTIDKFKDVSFSDRGPAPRVVTAAAEGSARPINEIADIDHPAEAPAQPVAAAVQPQPLARAPVVAPPLAVPLAGLVALKPSLTLAVGSTFYFVNAQGQPQVLAQLAPGQSVVIHHTLNGQAVQTAVDVGTAIPAVVDPSTIFAVDISGGGQPATGARFSQPGKIALLPVGQAVPAALAQLPPVAPAPAAPQPAKPAQPVVVVPRAAAQPAVAAPGRLTQAIGGWGQAVTNLGLRFTRPQLSASGQAVVSSINSLFGAANINQIAQEILGKSQVATAADFQAAFAAIDNLAQEQVRALTAQLTSSSPQASTIVSAHQTDFVNYLSQSVKRLYRAQLVAKEVAQGAGVPEEVVRLLSAGVAIPGGMTVEVKESVRRSIRTSLALRIQENIISQVIQPGLQNAGVGFLDESAAQQYFDGLVSQAETYFDSHFAPTSGNDARTSWAYQWTANFLSTQKYVAFTPAEVDQAAQAILNELRAARSQLIELQRSSLGVQKKKLEKLAYAPANPQETAQLVIEDDRDTRVSFRDKFLTWGLRLYWQHLVFGPAKRIESDFAYRGYLQVDESDIVVAVKILKEVALRRAAQGKTTDFKWLIGFVPSPTANPNSFIGIYQGLSDIDPRIALYSDDPQEILEILDELSRDPRWSALEAKRVTSPRRPGTNAYQGKWRSLNYNNVAGYSEEQAENPEWRAIKLGVPTGQLGRENYHVVLKDTAGIPGTFAYSPVLVTAPVRVSASIPEVAVVTPDVPAMVVLAAQASGASPEVQALVSALPDWRGRGLVFFGQRLEALARLVSRIKLPQLPPAVSLPTGPTQLPAEATYDNLVSMIDLARSGDTRRQAELAGLTDEQILGMVQISFPTSSPEVQTIYATTVGNARNFWQAEINRRAQVPASRFQPVISVTQAFGSRARATWDSLSTRAKLVLSTTLLLAVIISNVLAPVLPIISLLTATPRAPPVAPAPTAVVRPVTPLPPTVVPPTATTVPPTVIPPTATARPAVQPRPGTVGDVAARDPDINMEVRGWGPAKPVLGGKGFIDVLGPVSSKAPQLNTLIGEKVEDVQFVELFQVNERDGKTPIKPSTENNWGVTAVRLSADPGTPIQVPFSTNGPLFGDSKFNVIVLLATDHSLTLHYAPDDAVPYGYLVHIDDIDVDKTVLVQYQDAVRSGRAKLPALVIGQVVGKSLGKGPIVAIRDTGSYMDPRSRKDWWTGAQPLPLNYAAPVLHPVDKNKYSPSQPVSEVAPSAAQAAAFGFADVSFAVSNLAVDRQDHLGDLDNLRLDLVTLRALADLVTGKTGYEGVSARITGEIAATEQAIAQLEASQARAQLPFGLALFAREPVSAVVFGQISKFVNTTTLMTLAAINKGLYEKVRAAYELNNLERDFIDRSKSPLVTLGSRIADPWILKQVAQYYPGPEGIDKLIAHYRNLPENNVTTDAQLVILATRLKRYQELVGVGPVIAPAVLEPRIGLPESPAALAPAAQPPAVVVPVQPAAPVAQPPTPGFTQIPVTIFGRTVVLNVPASPQALARASNFVSSLPGRFRRFTNLETVRSLVSLQPIISSPRTPILVKSILSGSRQGIIARTINSSPFGIGRTDWTRSRTVTDTFLYYMTRATFQPLLLWDGLRVVRWMSGGQSLVDRMSQKVLAEMSIDQTRIKGLSQGKELLDFINKRLIDPGFQIDPQTQRVLPAGLLPTDLVIYDENGAQISGPARDEILAKYKENRPAQPVFRSFVVPRLLSAGYHFLNLDIGSLSAANAVSGSPKNIVGDYLINDVVTAVTQELGEDYFVIRTGGDEFAIASKNPVTPELVSRVTAAATSVKSLFAEKGPLTLRQATVKVTETSPADLAEEVTSEVEPPTLESLGQRVNRLNTFHPELVPLVASVQSLNNLAEISDTLKFIEDMLFDPVLDPVLTDLILKDQMKVESLIDPTDLISHVKRRGPKSELLRIDVPGVLKELNDTQGYNAGNEFLRYFFRKLAVAANAIYPDVVVYRRGGDFYLDLPADIPTQEAINTLTQALTGQYQVGEKNYPVIPAIVATPLTLTAQPLNGFEVPPGDEEALSRTLEILSDAVWPKTLEQLKNYYMTAAAHTTAGWQFLANYFDPGSRRGSLRLTKISPAWMSALSPFYYNKAIDGKSGLREENLPDVQRLLIQILTGQPAPQAAAPVTAPSQPTLTRGEEDAILAQAITVAQKLNYTVNPTDPQDVALSISGLIADIVGGQVSGITTDSPEYKILSQAEPISGKRLDEYVGISPEPVAPAPPKSLLGRIADWYFAIRPFEKGGKIYETLQVPLFKKWMPTSGDVVYSLIWRRLFHASPQVSVGVGTQTERSIRTLIATTKDMEAIHLFFGNVFFALMILPVILVGDIPIFVIGLVANLLVNIYPVMVQRYNRDRAEQILVRLESRRLAVPAAPVAPAPPAVTLPEQFTVSESSAQEARVLQQDLAQRYPGQLWAGTQLVDFDLTFVARNTVGKIVGVLQLRPLDATSAYIDMLEVDPDYQSKGIGKQLLDAVKARQWNKITLTASPLDILETAPVAEQNAARERLMQYYESQGFTRIQPAPNEPIKIFGQMVWQKPSAAPAAVPVPAAPVAPIGGVGEENLGLVIPFDEELLKVSAEPEPQGVDEALQAAAAARKQIDALANRLIDQGRRTTGNSIARLISQNSPEPVVKNEIRRQITADAVVSQAVGLASVDDKLILAVDFVYSQLSRENAFQKFARLTRGAFRNLYLTLTSYREANNLQAVAIEFNLLENDISSESPRSQEVKDLQLAIVGRDVASVRTLARRAVVNMFRQNRFNTDNLAAGSELSRLVQNLTDKIVKDVVRWYLRQYNLQVLAAQAKNGSELYVTSDSVDVNRNRFLQVVTVLDRTTRQAGVKMPHKPELAQFFAGLRSYPQADPKVLYSALGAFANALGSDPTADGVIKAIDLGNQRLTYVSAAPPAGGLPAVVPAQPVPQVQPQPRVLPPVTVPPPIQVAPLPVQPPLALPPPAQPVTPVAEQIVAETARFNSLKTQLKPDLIAKYALLSPVSFTFVPTPQNVTLDQIKANNAALEKFIKKVNTTEGALNALAAIEPNISSLDDIRQAQQVIANSQAQIDRHQDEVFGPLVLPALQRARLVVGTEQKLGIAQSLNRRINPEVQNFIKPGIVAKGPGFDVTARVNGLVTVLLVEAGLTTNDPWRETLTTFVGQRLAPFVEAAMVAYQAKAQAGRPAPPKPATPTVVETVADAAQAIPDAAREFNKAMEEERRAQKPVEKVVDAAVVLVRAAKTAGNVRKAGSRAVNVLKEEVDDSQRLRAAKQAVKREAPQKERVVVGKVNLKEVRLRTINVLATIFSAEGADTSGEVGSLVKQIFVNKDSVVSKPDEELRALRSDAGFTGTLERNIAASEEKQWFDDLERVATLIGLFPKQKVVAQDYGLALENINTFMADLPGISRAEAIDLVAEVLTRGFPPEHIGDLASVYVPAYNNALLTISEGQAVKIPGQLPPTPASLPEFLDVSKPFRVHLKDALEVAIEDAGLADFVKTKSFESLVNFLGEQVYNGLKAGQPSAPAAPSALPPTAVAQAGLLASQWWGITVGSLARLTRNQNLIDKSDEIETRLIAWQKVPVPLWWSRPTPPAAQPAAQPGQFVSRFAPAQLYDFIIGRIFRHGAIQPGPTLPPFQPPLAPAQPANVVATVGLPSVDQIPQDKTGKYGVSGETTVEFASVKQRQLYHLGKLLQVDVGDAQPTAWDALYEKAKRQGKILLVHASDSPFPFEQTNYSSASVLAPGLDGIFGGTGGYVFEIDPKDLLILFANDSQVRFAPYRGSESDTLSDGTVIYHEPGHLPVQPGELPNFVRSGRDRPNTDAVVRLGSFGSEALVAVFSSIPEYNSYWRPELFKHTNVSLILSKPNLDASFLAERDTYSVRLAAALSLSVEEVKALAQKVFTDVEAQIRGAMGTVSVRDNILLGQPSRQKLTPLERAAKQMLEDQLKNCGTGVFRLIPQIYADEAGRGIGACAWWARPLNDKQRQWLKDHGWQMPWRVILGGAGRLLAGFIIPLGNFNILITPTPTATPSAGLTSSPQAGSGQAPSLTVGPQPILPVKTEYQAGFVIGLRTPEAPKAEDDPDLNLNLRKYMPVSGKKSIIWIGGEFDPKAPQLSTLIAGLDRPEITSLYRICEPFTWRAGTCTPYDNRAISDESAVSVLGLTVEPGRIVRVPNSGYDLGAGFQAMVLYVCPQKDCVVLNYVPDDAVKKDYTIYLNDFTVDMRLADLYDQWKEKRTDLPVLTGLQPLGIADGREIKVLIRDSGQFMDPRSKKDWWANAPGTTP